MSLSNNTNSNSASGASPKPMPFDEFSAAVEIGSLGKETVDFILPVVTGSDDEITYVLQTLSELYATTGEGGGFAFTIKNPGERDLIVEAKPLPFPDVSLIDIQSAELNQYLELGGYADPEEFILHALAVFEALLRIYDTPLFLLSDKEAELFDILARESVAEDDCDFTASSDTTHDSPITFDIYRTPEFEKLMRLGEFTSPLDCVEKAMGILATILKAHHEGGRLVQKLGDDDFGNDEFIEVQLPGFSES